MMQPTSSSIQQRANTERWPPPEQTQPAGLHQNNPAQPISQITENSFWAHRLGNVIIFNLWLWQEETLLFTMSQCVNIPRSKWHWKYIPPCSVLAVIFSFFLIDIYHYINFRCKTSRLGILQNDHHTKSTQHPPPHVVTQFFFLWWDPLWLATFKYNSVVLLSIVTTLSITYSVNN